MGMNRSPQKIISYLNTLYNEEIKNAHFIGNENTMSHYIKLLSQGDFTYH